jgi:hypothetical protein
MTSRHLDNPFAAAQKFLEMNELPLTYIDEVVKFIEKNTAGVNIGTGGEDYVDPYTGDEESHWPLPPHADTFSRRLKVQKLSGFGTHRAANLYIHGSLYWCLKILWCSSSRSTDD